MSRSEQETFRRYGKPVTVWRDPITGRFVKSPLSYIFVWHCLSDACPKCQALNGREWRDQDLFQDVLFDVIWGDLWDLNADYPLTHPNCRCQLEVRVEERIAEMDEYIEFKDMLELMM